MGTTDTVSFAYFIRRSIEITPTIGTSNPQSTQFRYSMKLACSTLTSSDILSLPKCIAATLTIDPSDMPLDQHISVICAGPLNILACIMRKSIPVLATTNTLTMSSSVAKKITNMPKTKPPKYRQKLTTSQRMHGRVFPICHPSVDDDVSDRSKNQVEAMVHAPQPATRSPSWMRPAAWSEGPALHELQEALDFIQATVKDTLKDQVARNHLEPNDSKWCHHEKPELEIDGPVIGEQQNHNQQKRVGHQHGCRRNLETSDKLCLELIPSKGMSFKFFIVAQSKQHHVERLVLVQPSGEEQGEENWQEYYSSQQSQLAWQMDSHLDAGPRIHVPIGQVDRNH
eukprot:CAMPEP_0177169988 /NCGR_PEP_ID=MMETSP0367-20130122/9858_1 /TAXON_ID=447022 ORGANISM="Scrippsiella hangoei-like, Strain SHHI-4" /NCGR_SAMPLE_ID=MMETSP0367 /ASSEMBLY_ACC=CAM_ASM_000362 /LENGTH=340 /DNA_ID=CAMNT_0018616155 /DNA_START=287 /DNA_END=1311 /DNA_ORIENTATION=+